MKQFFTIVSAVFFFTTARAQITPSTYQDTVNYLNTEIVAKKNLYIGKQFSVLLNNLKIKPVRLSLDMTTPADSLKGRVSALYFNYSTVFKSQHYIIIDWQNPIPWSVFSPVFYKMTYQEQIDYYKDIIIKDIDIKDYSQNDLEDE